MNIVAIPIQSQVYLNTTSLQLNLPQRPNPPTLLLLNLLPCACSSSIIPIPADDRIPPRPPSAFRQNGIVSSTKTFPDRIFCWTEMSICTTCAVCVFDDYWRIEPIHFAPHKLLYLLCDTLCDFHCCSER